MHGPLRNIPSHQDDGIMCPSFQVYRIVISSVRKALYFNSEQRFREGNQIPLLGEMPPAGTPIRESHVREVDSAAGDHQWCAVLTLMINFKW